MEYWTGLLGWASPLDLDFCMTVASWRSTCSTDPVTVHDTIALSQGHSHLSMLHAGRERAWYASARE